MRLLLIGTSHKYTPLEARERLSFSKSDVTLALQAMLEKEIARGAVIVSTCHRVEIYAEAKAVWPLRNFFLTFKEYPNSGEGLYIKQDEEVVRHLFNVAAGLDSQVVGEREILYQVKDAYLKAKEFRATTPLLNKVFERALFVGRLVRRETDIAKENPSVASVAVSHAQKIARLNKKKVFIIGAGPVARRVAELCAGKSAGSIIVANRTFEKAEALAGDVGGKAVRFGEFYDALDKADIIFSATGSRHLILRKEAFEQKRHGTKRLIIFDLAFPRDVDPAIGDRADVTLFNVDDFKENRFVRNQEVERAFGLVREKLARFLKKEDILWRSELVQGPALLH